MLTIEKDPNANLNYSVNWARWLEAGTLLTASEWVVPAGLTKESESFTTTKATVVLSGGTAGVTYTVTNRITFTGGLGDDRSISIICVER